MPPTRKLSRSKQQNEQSDDLDSKNEQIVDETIDDEKTRRKSRSRRSTASSVQLDNDLNENDITTVATTTARQGKKQLSTEQEPKESVSSSPFTRKTTLQRQQSPEKKESDIKLRRRDKLRGTDRYSPEIHEPARRSKRPLSFPSTSASQNKYINYESFDDETSLSTQTSNVNTSGQRL